MSSQRYRLSSGLVTRYDTPLNFTFDGKSYQGYQGDTLASALLAAGVHLVGRSFKYHRPRGIMSAGAEEANALMRVGTGAFAEPNLKATQVELYEGLVATSQNRFPSLKLDIGSINSLFAQFLPAGFYYKTFMWPASLWMTYEHFIRKAAGLGKVASDPIDPERYEKTHRHCEILVAGGGPAGLMAAYQAAQSGLRVILADEAPQFGGWMLSDEAVYIDGMVAADWVSNLQSKLATMDNVTLLPRTTVFGYGDHNYISMAERVTDHLSHRPAHLPRMRLWKVRAGQAILATGCIERPLVFVGNDLPGIMLSSAVQTYITKYGVLPGRRAVIFTNNDTAYKTALSFQKAGGFVRAIIDTRAVVKGVLVRATRDAGIEILSGHAVSAAHGIHHVGRVEIAPLSSDGESLAGEALHMDCDLVMMSGGLTPTVHLHSQARGKLVWDKKHSCFAPGATHEAAKSVGACNGTFDLARGLREAIRVAVRTVRTAGGQCTALDMPEVSAQKVSYAPMAFWSTPSSDSSGRGLKAFVDFQNDVTSSDIRLAVREGYQSVEHVKRYTTTGMATDQGKTSNMNALGILADALGHDIPEVGTTTFRMPYTPTSMGMIAGREIGELFDAVRLTRMDSWHRAAGATFEHVGQWMRAWYYPQGDETMEQAVRREVSAARQTAGLLDASTLGKIDIRGKDAAMFLDRIYTNKFSTLAIGKCRYGLMLKEDGMVMDDGVTSRLDFDHFYMTTTTSGATNVFDWLEEWLQTEWPELDVYLTSVTEQWSVATLSGPNAREILEAAGTSIDLSDREFPFMSMKEGYISGLPARLFRISFTGELSYEINVPARYGLALWQVLINAGKSHGITPYGTEAMHVLRAEKGFIIVGQETDGTVTPIDLGMSWILSKKKTDFIGKRALERASMADPKRKQLVGLRTINPDCTIPEGAQVVLDPDQPLPMDMLGHVTSSYASPTLGHSIALALLKGGHTKHGETVWIPMLDGQPPIQAVITNTVFYDAQGDRLNGPGTT